MCLHLLWRPLLVCFHLLGQPLFVHSPAGAAIVGIFPLLGMLADSSFLLSPPNDGVVTRVEVTLESVLIVPV